MRFLEVTGLLIATFCFAASHEGELVKWTKFIDFEAVDSNKRWLEFPAELGGI